MSYQAHVTDVAYCYDGSFAGFLCCVFESYARREIPAEVCPPEEGQLNFFGARDKESPESFSGKESTENANLPSRPNKGTTATGGHHPGSKDFASHPPGAEHAFTVPGHGLNGLGYFRHRANRHSLRVRERIAIIKSIDIGEADKHICFDQFGDERPEIVVIAEL